MLKKAVKNKKISDSGYKFAVRVANHEDFQIKLTNLLNCSMSPIVEDLGEEMIRIIPSILVENALCGLYSDIYSYQNKMSMQFLNLFL